MISKTTILFLAALLVLANAQLSMGQGTAAEGSLRAKTQVKRLGPGAKVTVYLRDGKKIKGSISQVLDDSFDITPDKETQARIISYGDVRDVRKRSWPTAAKVGLGVGAGFALMVVVVFLYSKAK